MVSLKPGVTAVAVPNAAAFTPSATTTASTTRMQQHFAAGWPRSAAGTGLMLFRSLLRVVAAVAFAALIAPVVPSAAPPPGLAYDEIVRVVVNATPPPPGNFQSDLAAVTSQAVAASPTPAP